MPLNDGSKALVAGQAEPGQVVANVPRNVALQSSRLRSSFNDAKEFSVPCRDVARLAAVLGCKLLQEILQQGLVVEQDQRYPPRILPDQRHMSPAVRILPQTDVNNLRVRSLKAGVGSDNLRGRKCAL